MRQNKDYLIHDEGEKTMTTKEYFRQVYRLEYKIRYDIEELASLRELATSLAAFNGDERVQTSRNTDAPFIEAIEKITEMEELINNEVNRLIELKREVQQVISKVDDMYERLVLKYRYLHDYTWRQIGQKLYADEKTIRRWHAKALKHVVIPQK